MGSLPTTHRTPKEQDVKTRHKKTQLVYLNNNNINEYELRFERAPPNTSIDLDLKNIELEQLEDPTLPLLDTWCEPEKMHSHHVDGSQLCGSVNSS